jgi:hypothetical protein
MFTRLFSLSCCLLGVCLAALGQSTPPKPQVTLSEQIGSSRRETLEDIVGYDRTGYYVLKYYKGKQVVARFSKGLALEKSVELDLGKGSEKREYERIVQIKEKLYLFTSRNESKTKHNVLYAQELDKGTLKPAANLTKITQMEYEKRRNDGGFQFRLAADSSALLVHYNLPYDKGSPEKFGFLVYGPDLKLRWQKQVTLPYPDELFAVNSIRLDGQGGVYLLGKLYQDKVKEKRRGLPNFEYRLLSCTAAGNATKEYNIRLRDKFITDVQFAVKENGQIICSGFYSEKGVYSIKGAFFMTLDATSKAPLGQHLQEFDADFLTEFMSESKAKKGGELYEYDLDDLVMRDDGGVVLVAEQYYHYTHTYYSGTGMNRTMQTMHFYNYNDIIAVNINPDGKIAWTKKIPKHQTSVNDGGFFSSYTLSVINNKLYFLFNDSPRNLDNSPGDRTVNFNGRRSSVVVLVQLDRGGNLEKVPLFTAKDADVITRPKVCEQVSANEVILYGQKKSNHKFARVTL